MSPNTFCKAEIVLKEKRSVYKTSSITVAFRHNLIGGSVIECLYMYF